MRFSKAYQRIAAFTLVAASGSLFEVSCGGLGEKLVQNVNPCGTILNCDPLEYDLITKDYPDWSLDPTCTIPGFCGGPFPPGSGADTQ